MTDEILKECDGYIDGILKIPNNNFHYCNKDGKLCDITLASVSRMFKNKIEMISFIKTESSNNNFFFFFSIENGLNSTLYLRYCSLPTSYNLLHYKKNLMGIRNDKINQILK